MKDIRKFLEEELSLAIQEEEDDKKFLENLYDPNCYGSGYNRGQRDMLERILERLDDYKE